MPASFNLPTYIPYRRLQPKTIGRYSTSIYIVWLLKSSLAEWRNFNVVFLGIGRNRIVWVFAERHPYASERPQLRKTYI